MYCPEYNRLRPLYEVAIRQWGHIILSPNSDSLATPISLEAKEKAYRERDAAKERLNDHALSCLTCNRKPRGVH
jgi:hypothetical protein